MRKTQHRRTDRLLRRHHDRCASSHRLHCHHRLRQGIRTGDASSLPVRRTVQDRARMAKLSSIAGAAGLAFRQLHVTGRVGRPVHDNAFADPSCYDATHCNQLTERPEPAKCSTWNSYSGDPFLPAKKRRTEARRLPFEFGWCAVAHPSYAVFGHLHHVVADTSGSFALAACSRFCSRSECIRAYQARRCPAAIC
jgi:hypothetical protein